MKKRIFPLAPALLLCLGLATPAFASESDFRIYDGVLEKYTGPGGHVTIPDSVTRIGWWAFDGCTSLTKVKMPIGLWLQSTWPTPDDYIMGIGDFMSEFLGGELRPFHVRGYSFDLTPFGTRHVVIQMTVFFLLVAAAIGIPLYRRKVAIRKDPEGYARKKQEKQERKAAKKEAKQAAGGRRATRRFY